MLDVSKAIQESDIPVKIITANENFFAEAICFYFNKSLENGKFPNCLKLANTTSVFKPGARTSKNNYRPISILSAFSKISERPLSRQLLEFFDIYYINFKVVLERDIKLNIAYYWCLKFGKKLLTIIKLFVHLSQAFRSVDILRPYTWTTFVQHIYVWHVLDIKYHVLYWFCRW